MRKRSKHRSRWVLQPDINLNSFLDLILNVLLFFVFATEIAAFHALEVTVPSSKSSNEQTRDKDEIIVYITKENKMSVDGQFFDKDQFTAWLQKNKNTDVSKNYVIIRGDLNSHLQSTVDVLTACRIAQINRIKVETKDPN